MDQESNYIVPILPHLAWSGTLWAAASHPLLGTTFGFPVVTFEALVSALLPQRLHLPLSSPGVPIFELVPASPCDTCIS